MGLSLALSSALSGMRSTQTGLELVSSNIANASTPGYTRKSTSLSADIVNGRAAGVNVDAITRAIDTYTQRQLRTETSGLAYANVKSSYLSNVDKLFGTPGSDTSLDTLIDTFSNALDTLATSPESESARIDVLNNAQLLTQSLNGMSADVQSLREDANTALRSSVDTVNDILDRIAKVSSQIISSGATSSPDLLDQRDQLISQLSEQLDVNIIQSGTSLSISTGNGIPLYSDGVVSKLRFANDAHVSAQSAYSEDPAESTLGTIMVDMPSGTSADLLGSNGVRSGEIRAYAELRDELLPQAQAQLDAVASSLAQALGSNEVQGVAVPPASPPPASGTPAGFSLDLSQLSAGNSFSLSVTTAPATTPSTFTFVRVDDPATLPLSNDLTADPNDRVVGIDFSGDLTSVAAQVQSVLGSGYSVTATADGIQILDDGATGNTEVNSLSATVSATDLYDGNAGLPLFVDSGTLYGAYTGSLDGIPQEAGFAGRITINPDLLDDPSKLVEYGAGISASDTTRPSFLRDALNETGRQFSASTGIGGVQSPFTGSIADFARQAISDQAQKSDFATSVQEGQQVVVTSLQDRMSEVSGVDTDQEMGKLIQLQTAYAANARVITTVKEMMDLLLQI